MAATPYLSGLSRVATPSQAGSCALAGNPDPEREMRGRQCVAEHEEEQERLRERGEHAGHVLAEPHERALRHHPYGPGLVVQAPAGGRDGRNGEVAGERGGHQKTSEEMSAPAGREI